MAKDKLGNLAYVKLRDNDISEFDSRISSVESEKHTHSNKAILDSTEEAFTTILKDKIESSTTSADVESIVSGLVDSAPSTLDTLNELAQALGDDPNFATTVSTQIGQKQDTIPSGTTAQYYRGDKTWATMPTSLPASDVYTWAKASTKPSYIFTEIGSRPTTLSGYGITDSVSTTSKQSLHATDALRVSGTTVSLYKGDGTYESITTQDTNTWRGITDSVSTTSSTTSASATAVKAAYDVGNHSHPYLPTAGGTLTGDLVTTSGSANGIFIGTSGANITSVSPSSKDIVIQNLQQLRFGNTGEWDWDKWAGIKYDASTTTMTIGSPASSSFTSNSSPSLINVNFDGLNTNGLQCNGNTVYHAGNDGSGSGLDADKLDGNEASAFALSGHTHSHLDALGSYVWTASTDARNYPNGLGLSFVSNTQGFPNYGSVVTVKTYGNDGGTLQLYTPYSDSYGGVGLQYRRGLYNNAGWTSWNKIWSSENDGSGSGLDADTLDGVQASQFLRSDANDTFTGNLTGTNASISLGHDVSSIDNTVGCSNWFRSSGNTGWYNTTYGGGIYMTDSTWVRTYNGKQFYVSSASSEAIKTAGGILVSGTITETSDKRFKKDIQKIDNALDKVNQVNGYTFEKDGHDGRLTGVIAQEVEAILPEAIQKNEDGYLSVSYGNLVGLLIESIKELNAKVEKLENAQKS